MSLIQAKTLPMQTTISILELVIVYGVAMLSFMTMVEEIGRVLEG